MTKPGKITMFRIELLTYQTDHLGNTTPEHIGFLGEPVATREAALTQIKDLIDAHDTQGFDAAQDHWWYRDFEDDKTVMVVIRHF